MPETFPFTTAPDWGLTDNVEADVEEQKLGDGYELVRPKGINYLRESWSPSWTFLTKEESDAMYQWLRARLKVTPFLWTHPVTKVVHKVRCNGVSRAATDVDLYAIQMNITETFNV